MHDTVAADDDSLGELQIAEYILLTLALETYVTHVELVTGNPANDGHTQKGVKLLKLADSKMGPQVEAHLLENIARPESQRAIQRTFKVRVSNTTQSGRRAATLKTAFNKNKATTLKSVFTESRARKEVKAAIAAATLDEPSEAIAKFAAIAIQNPKIKKWVRDAKILANSGEIIVNPVEVAADAAADKVSELRIQQVQEDGTTSAEDVREAQEESEALIQQVQDDATEAAQMAIEAAGAPDEPVTRSEVVGIATATAVAVASDPGNEGAIPESLKKLDPEQRAAALTDGRVLVAAGAGAGKSTTLAARVRYLVEERGVAPSRIMVTSFNTKAADELKEKMSEGVGREVANQMSGGGKHWTMHSIFLNQVRQFGDPSEKAAMNGNFGLIGGATAKTVQSLWSDCFDEETRPVPKRKDMEMAKTKWSGNGVKPSDLEPGVPIEERSDAALWYEMYEGLKGAIPGWQPPCEERSKEIVEDQYQAALDKWRASGGKSRKPQRRKTSFEYYMATHRPQGNRVGDFDDMISMFRDILVRDPGARKRMQQMFDHVLVDECQDLNAAQHDIFRMITEHIKEGDSRSLWLVGDDKQSIYTFRGARPDLFIGLDEDPDWQTRQITTNYRCAPEIVDAGNQLIAHNESQLPIEAKPSKSKTRGNASVRVLTPQNDTEAALGIIEDIKNAVSVYDDPEDRAKALSDYAVLCRTNSEIHAYETSCIIRGIPYARKGASGIFGSPETKTVLSYLQVVAGDDNLKKQKAFGLIFNKPKRFFISEKKGQEVVEKAVREYANAEGLRINEVDPIAAMQGYGFTRHLISALGLRGYSAQKASDALDELSDHLGQMQANMQEEGYKTTDFFDEVLMLPGVSTKVDPITGKTVYGEQTLRESFVASSKDAMGDKDEDETEELGSLAFLYELSEVDPTDPGDLERDPGTPLGFKDKMDRYVQKMRDLSVDLTKYSGKTEDLSALYLGTAHSVKGLQWPNVVVNMPAGKFPIEIRKADDDDTPDDPDHLENERRLGYVALTRAKTNLTVVCPDKLGGNDAGVSSFVAEAGLVPGENVQVPDTGTDFVEDQV